MWKKKIDEYVAVSGMPGIFKTSATRNNGLLIEDMDSKKTKFISIRKHQFTPLGTVSIYTDDDTVELKKVFHNMLEQFEDNPPPATSSSKDILMEYFEDVLPTYDKDQVYVSDVKKVIKWFKFLHDRSFFVDSHDEEE